ncbi:response regulator [Ramlibacter sp. MAHUQ-53]|uniref:response regulator n=1 Tax=unclassified Ramlibacter TaxID=2617605 RepID=UPI003627283D
MTAPRPLNVLLVEDDPIHQVVSRRLLEQLGAHVDLAPDGLQALAAATRTAYDLVFMDIQMPVMDGVRATRALRHAGLDKLPVIAMTSQASAADQRVYAQAGLNDLVPKPVDARRLADTLERWRPARQAQAAEEPLPPLTPHLDALPQGIPGLDVAGAVQRLLGNTALYREMLQRYADSQERVPGLVRAALDAGDRELACREVHTARSLAATVGALRVWAEAQSLERCLRDDAPETEWKPVLTRLEKQLHLLLGALRAQLEMQPQAA